MMTPADAATQPVLAMWQAYIPFLQTNGQWPASEAQQQVLQEAFMAGAVSLYVLMGKLSDMEDDGQQEAADAGMQALYLELQQAGTRIDAVMMSGARG